MYTLDYFINKFSAIPEDKWTTRTYTDSFGRHCAYGHCGCDIEAQVNPEVDNLSRIIEDYNRRESPQKPLYLIKVNDGRDWRFNQDTPKKRVLAVLLRIKAKEPVEISNPPLYIEDIINEGAIV